MVANRSLIYKKTPRGLPVPGQDLVVEDRPFDLEAPPPPGGLVVEVLYASFDPYLRGRMRDPRIKSYSPPFPLNEPVPEDTIARVLASDSDQFQPGDLVLAYLPIAEYARVPADVPKVRLLPGVRRLPPTDGLEVAHWLGALGMPGLTAYAGLLNIGKPQAGETIFVSSAAGAVGQLVGQIAKRRGLKVIGSVGSDEKLAFITEELGFDGGFNYKKEKPADALPRLAPQGIDIYFENVGGDHLEAALENLNVGGRIPVCGLISEYNRTEPDTKGIKGISQILRKQLVVQGFLVGSPDFGPHYYEEQQANVKKWLLDGSFKAKLSITEGIENGPAGFVGMLEGKNFGKAVLKIKE